VEGYKPSAEPVVAYWQAVWEIVMVAGAKSLRLVHVLLNIAESNSWQLYEEQVPEVERQDLRERERQVEQELAKRLNELTMAKPANSPKP
jgi:rubrerythrin